MVGHLGDVRRIWPYVRPYRRLFAALWALTGLGALVALIQPWPFAFVVDSVIGQKDFPASLAWLADRPVWLQLVIGVCLTLAVSVLAGAVTVAAETVATKLELHLVLDYRSDLFAHAQRLPLAYHDAQRKGAFIYQINFHAHSAGSVVTAVPPLAQALLTLVGMFAVTYRLDATLALVATAVAPLLFACVRFYARYVQTELFRVRNLEGESMSIIHESMSMIHVVVANVRERHEHDLFRAQAQRAIGARVRLTVVQTVFSLVVTLVTALGTGAVVFLGAQAVLAKEITLGELLVVLAYVAAIYRPMEQIAHTFGTLQETLVNLGLSFDLLDTPVGVEDKPDALPLPRARGHLVFEGVSYGYPTRPDVLRELTFEIRPGERVAIVGPTGAGKSTLVGLVARFADPQQGRILLDGHDLRDLRLADVRNAIGFVLQEPELFQGSVLDNIRYGRLEATDAEVRQAARDAGAHEFVSALPSGYHTQVGERGGMLSGGERQRLCVARAFVRDAPILVLDEPTSSIDTRTEQGILDALARLAEGRTTIIIAHRLSTVRGADRVLVLDGGRIVEAGPPAELLAAGGVYAALAAAQGMVADPAGAPAALPPPDPAQLDAARPAPAPAPAAPGPPGVAGPPKVVVLGMLTKMPVAGAAWQVVHYLVGLQRLGVEVVYVEAHARTPSMFLTTRRDTGSVRAARYLADLMGRIGMADRWAFHALHDDGAVHGMSPAELARWYREADAIVNLHGGTEPLPEHAATGRLVYVETDPGALAVELAEGRPETVAFLEPHTAFFSFAENWGAPDCGLPVTDRFCFLPTRQPVVRDFWEPFGTSPADRFTTVGNWRQLWRAVDLGGETYQWSKHFEFAKFLELPSRVPVPLELALASFEPADRELLEQHGWRVREALSVSGHLTTYRRYVAGSMGEFTVAKDQNVRLRTGWFSDRSATYLAAGRPVVTQDTGFGRVLPVGEGLFAVRDVDEAAAAVEAVVAHEDHHRRAARDLAAAHFDHEVVLRPLLSAVGVEVPSPGRRRPRPAATAGAAALTGPLDDLELTPLARRPLVLAPDTVARVLERPLPEPPPAEGSGSRRVSVVVVTHGQLPVTRLCLESVLAHTRHPNLELVVVDNASGPDVRDYLGRLAAAVPQVQVVLNEDNRGYAAALNQGVEVAGGEILVVLNNDVIVAPGWLHGLAGHLDDPGVGMVGPVTNAAPNEARVPVGYATYAGFLAEADERARGRRREETEVEVLTLFCTMLRRRVLEQVGPFDERFGIGLFEDDDYSLRVRRAGLRLVVAEDVLVHHFGEAAFGDLVPSGAYGRLFRENRRRFEEKWGVSWAGHRHRPDPVHDAFVERVRRRLDEVVPAGEPVAVAAKGERAWLGLERARAVQFPQDPSGCFDGAYPASSAEAVALVERLRAEGVRHVAFPASSRWWLDHYEGLRAHLGVEYEVLADDADVVVFRARAMEAAPAWA